MALFVPFQEDAKSEGLKEQRMNMTVQTQGFLDGDGRLLRATWQARTSCERLRNDPPCRHPSHIRSSWEGRGDMAEDRAEVSQQLSVTETRLQVIL